MCGRYTLTVTGKVLAEFFGVETAPWETPRYKIAPGQEAPIVRHHGGRPGMVLCRWGLVPAWARDPSSGPRPINARAETAAVKPSFRSAFRKRRCLIPADGFYEWKATPAGKQPWYFHRTDRGPFAMAGLWEMWQDPSSEPLLTFTVLTTGANGLVAPIHGRMPVILPAHQWDRWLDPSVEDPAILLPLLRPGPPGEMTAHPVSRAVGSPPFDDPRCIDPPTSPAN